jgi:hypothetical protein
LLCVTVKAFQLTFYIFSPILYKLNLLGGELNRTLFRRFLGGGCIRKLLLN